MKVEAQHEDDRDDAQDGHDDGGLSARQKRHEIEVQHVAQHQQLVHVEKAQQRREHVVDRPEQHAMLTPIQARKIALINIESVMLAPNTSAATTRCTPRSMTDI